MAAALILLAAGGIAAAIALEPRAPVPAPAPVPLRPAPRPPAPKLQPTPTPAPVLEVKRVLDMGPSIAFGDWAWDERGAPAGPVVITVDLKAQTMSVFRGGHEIGAAAVLYGADDKPTPLGTFPIRGKTRDHWSRKYDAPMPYTLWLTADGVAIHGTEVQWGYATHGCIGVPNAFAAKLFAAAKTADRVIVTKGAPLLKPGDRIG